MLPDCGAGSGRAGADGGGAASAAPGDSPAAPVTAGCSNRGRLECARFFRRLRTRSCTSSRHVRSFFRIPGMSRSGSTFSRGGGVTVRGFGASAPSTGGATIAPQAGQRSP